MTFPLSEQYLAEHARIAAQLPVAGPFVDTRRAALARFVESGFPTTRVEDWRYTDLGPLSKEAFNAAATTNAGDITPYLPEGLDADRLVFIGGRFDHAGSFVSALPKGVHLSAASRTTGGADAVAAWFESGAQGSTPVIDLNTAFMSDGLFLDVPEGVVLARPIHVLFVAPAAAGAMTHVRNRVRVGRGASAVVVEHYVGSATTPQLASSLTHIELGAGARLRHCVVQQQGTGTYHLGHVFAAQQRDSNLQMHRVDLGARLARTDTQIRLEGPGSEVHLHGLYAPAGKQHIDNHTRVDHLAPHCISRELFRGVLNEQGRGVFNGKIVVHPGAIKTDSDQSSAALLLSKGCEVDAKPELEIYAGDVKCAHGATVGQLDEDALFYLQSRGLDYETARTLLTYSFADEVIRETGIDPLRRYIERHFLARLPAGDIVRGLL